MAFDRGGICRLEIATVVERKIIDERKYEYLHKLELWVDCKNIAGDFPRARCKEYGCT